MNRFLPVAILLLAGCGPKPITIEPVKLPDFEKAIASHKGKIVVIDLWADWCEPCKEHFHNLVDIHNRHAGKGVVCMSASVDNVKDKDKCLKFLVAQKADFPNYLIDEKSGVWQERWDITAVPGVLVYGRDGTLSKKFTWDDPANQFTYADVEKYVVGLTAAK